MADGSVRDEIAATLRECVDDGHEEQHAAWLLPVVERLQRQAAAREMDGLAVLVELRAGNEIGHAREAVADVGRFVRSVAARLRDRADGIEAT